MIGITIVGYVLIPVGLVMFVCSSRYALLYLTIFFAPFTATAVVNLPGLGVQPGYYLGALFIARCLLEGAVRKGPRMLSKYRLKRLLPFWLFCGVALLSILAIPLYDPVMVHRPSGIDELLALTQGNGTQYMYLLFATILITCIGLMDLRSEQVATALKGILASGLFVSLWGWVQLTCYFMGLPYPDFLFNSSVSFAQAYNVELSGLGLQRISSVAPEPSMFARFMLIPTFVSFYCVYRKGFLLRYRHAVALAFFFAVTSLLSTSSTAYAGLAGGFAFFLLKVLREQKGSVLDAVGLARRGGVILKSVAATGMLAVVALLVARFAVGLRLSSVVELINMMVFDKADSGSGRVRIAGAWQGLQLMAEHPLLGVGWGSNRTFDLSTYVLANTGAIGAVIFIWAHLALMGRAARVGRRVESAGGSERAGQLNVLVVALLVLLIGKMLAEPDILYLDQWVLIGLLVAATARFRAEVGRRRGARPLQAARARRPLVRR